MLGYNFNREISPDSVWFACDDTVDYKTVTEKSHLRPPYRHL